MNKYPNEIEPFAIETEASVARWNKLQRVTRERDLLIVALRDIEMETRDGGQFDAREINHVARAALAKVNK